MRDMPVPPPAPPPVDHGQHDPLLIAQLAAGDPLTTDQQREAALLVAHCAACASLAADLRAISSAVAWEPLPPRRRDFRIDPERAAAVARLALAALPAASLRPAGGRPAAGRGRHPLGGSPLHGRRRRVAGGCASPRPGGAGPQPGPHDADAGAGDGTVRRPGRRRRCRAGHSGCAAGGGWGPRRTSGVSDLAAPERNAAAEVEAFSAADEQAADAQAEERAVADPADTDPAVAGMAAEEVSAEVPGRRGSRRRGFCRGRRPGP